MRDPCFFEDDLRDEQRFVGSIFEFDQRSQTAPGQHHLFSAQNGQTGQLVAQDLAFMVLVMMQRLIVLASHAKPSRRSCILICISSVNLCLDFM